MAEEHHQKSHEYDGSVLESGGDAEVKDRGLFDFLSKKEEGKHDQEVMAAEFEEKVTVSEVDHEAKFEEEKEEKEEKPSLLEKLHRSGSSSSSSSDEEEGEDAEKKKKKKKGLKEKLKEKISGEEKKHEDTTVLVEKVEELHAPPVYAEPPHHTPEPIYVAEPVHIAEPPQVQPEEKKGFLEKIKEKLPGHKKAEEVSAAPPPTPAVECPPVDHEEPKEKKGIFDKIKEKLPGYHSKTEEEKEKGSAASSD